MTRKTDRQIFEEVLNRYEPIIRDAFLAAIDDVKNTATLRVIVDRLERGDIQGAIDALNLDPEVFVRLELAIQEAYNAGGQATVGNLPRVLDPSGNRVLFRWSIRNLEAEAWLRQYSSTLVTRIIEDQRAAIRVRLTEGLSQGENPRKTALDVVGRVSRTSNRREGGIIGLTAPQERFVSNARQELSSGDPVRLRAYLERERRDKRFDRTVLKAIKDGKPLDQETINRIVGRYSDKLLQLRGDMVGLNETMNAMARSRADAIRQQINAGKIDARDVTKVWKHTPNQHPRHHHQVMNGKSVPWGEKFQLPNGIMMDYPHDPDAPVSETIFCHCLFLVKIDYFAALERRQRA